MSHVISWHHAWDMTDSAEPYCRQPFIFPLTGSITSNIFTHHNSQFRQRQWQLQQIYRKVRSWFARFHVHNRSSVQATFWQENCTAIVNTETNNKWGGASQHTIISHLQHTTFMLSIFPHKFSLFLMCHCNFLSFGRFLLWTVIFKLNNMFIHSRYVTTRQYISIHCQLLMYICPTDINTNIKMIKLQCTENLF